MAGRVTSTQQPEDRSKQILGYLPEKALSCMPWHQPTEDKSSASLTQRHIRTTLNRYNANLEADRAAARAPSGPVVHIKIMMTDASREGRALVASGAPEPTIRQPSTCSSSRGLPNPPPSRKAAIGTVAGPPTARRSSRDAREAAVVAAKLHHEDAVDGFKLRFPVIHVAAASCAPRTQSPDHFGLRSHLEANARRSASPEEPARTTARCRVSRR